MQTIVLVRLDVTTWVALIILAVGAMLLILNEPGVIAGLDTATFGYVAFFSALIVYLGGGMLGSYRGRAGALLREHPGTQAVRSLERQIRERYPNIRRIYIETSTLSTAPEQAAKTPAKIST